MRYHVFSATWDDRQPKKLGAFDTVEAAVATYPEGVQAFPINSDKAKLRNIGVGISGITYFVREGK